MTVSYVMLFAVYMKLAKNGEQQKDRIIVGGIIIIAGEAMLISMQLLFPDIVTGFFFCLLHFINELHWSIDVV